MKTFGMVADGQCLVNAVVSMSRRNTQLEPTSYLKRKAKIAR